MFNESNCDRKSQVSGILTEPLNPRGILNPRGLLLILPILPVFPQQVNSPNLESPNQTKNISRELKLEARCS